MIGACAWVLASAWLYGPVLAKLVREWRSDPTYSHGFLVIPIALMLVWRQRDRLRRVSIDRPSSAGLLVVAASLAVYAVGILGAELFLTRVSLLGVIAGTIVFTRGWRSFRIVAFPLFFLLFMIPLPAIWFDRVAVSLQLSASSLGERMLQTAGVPVLRDGNILRLAHATLEVTDACSGIRSLVALVAMGAVAGYMFERSITPRLVISFAGVPLAVILNGIRIAVTGVLAARFGPRIALGTLHQVLGGLVFLAALAALGVLVWVTGRPPVGVGRRGQLQTMSATT